MELKILNIYERLRDFNVPASILDDIFNNQDDLNKLTDAWEALQKDNFKEDEIASKIADIFFKELDIPNEKEKGLN